MTYADLKDALAFLTPEELAQTVQVVKQHPCWDHVHAGLPAVGIYTVDEMDISYFRSADDNRRHGEQVVIYVDSPPANKGGVVAWEWNMRGEENKPIYPPDHSPDQDWTGPAQKIADEASKSRVQGAVDRDIEVAKLRSKTMEGKL